MSVRFNADADRLQRTTSLPAWNSYTFACFVQLAVDRNNFSSLFSLEENGSSYHVLETDSDGTTLFCYSGFTVALNLSITFGPLAVGTWYFVAITHDASNIRGYLGLAGPTGTPLAATTSSTDNTARTFGSMYLGGNGFAEPLDGRLAGVRVWDAVLSAAELENERCSFRPYRLDGLSYHLPLLNAAEKLVDFSGNGRDFSAPGAGAWETEENPPVAWRRPRFRPLAFSAGTAYTLAADPGAVVLAGGAAVLRAARQVDASAGAAALAGTAASLSFGRRLAAAAGESALAGADAVLSFGDTMAADVGAVALAGTAAQLVHGRHLVADGGFTALAGGDATLGAGYRMSCAAGAVALAGTAADLRIGSETEHPTATMSVAAGPSASLVVSAVPSATLTT